MTLPDKYVLHPEGGPRPPGHWSREFYRDLDRWFWQQAEMLNLVSGPEPDKLENKKE
jgi:hypothetical protein